MGSKTPNRFVLFAFGFVVLFTGINALAVKSTESELPPFFGAGIRFGAAAFILLIMVLLLRLPLPRGRSLLGAVLFGILGSGISRALLYLAMEKLQAGVSMVVLALVPLLTCLFACLHRQESFRWKSIAGSFLALGGVGVILNGQVSSNIPILPLLAVVAAAACFAEATVIIKAFPQSHPISTNAIALSTGSVFLFILSALSHESPTFPHSAPTWLSLFYLIIFGTAITFVLTIYVINNMTASASSYQFVLFPIVTIILGVSLAGETMDVALILGTAFVLMGVYVGVISMNGQAKFIHWRFLTRLRSSNADC